LKVVLIFRKRLAGSNSIEELFHSIAIEMAKQIEVVEFELGSRFCLLVDLWRLRCLRADIYHITGDVNYLSFFLPRRKTVLTVHDTGHYVHTLKGIKRWLYKWLWLVWPIRLAGKITTISEATRISINVDLDCTREVIVIDNCYGTVFHPVPKVFNEGSPLVLQVGTQPHKNLYGLINAIKETPCRLCIIGEINEENIRQLNKAGISYQNYFNLTHQEVFEKYIAADLVCFASLFEGFGVPIIEANIVGRPLITSNIEPMRSIASDSACLVNPTDIDAINQAIRRIVEDKKYREQLVINGLLNAQRYSPFAVAERYLNVYDDLLKNKHISLK
jgi:glycosyltransferase involved in cell wall biosynthesis